MADSLSISAVLQTLASLFERSKGGRTGIAARDFQVDVRDLLRCSQCEDGNERNQAERDLVEAEKRGILLLDRHKHDSSMIEKVRVPFANEKSLFAALETVTPSDKRFQLEQQISDASVLDIPNAWRTRWAVYFNRLKAAASAGDAMAPFSRSDLRGNAELIEILSKVLAWDGESMIRFASCVMCGDSKRLENLANKLNRILTAMCSGQDCTLESFGILEKPRSVLVHGPIRLHINGLYLDIGLLCGPVRLSESDVVRSGKLETGAARCLTVENETTFWELAKLQSGALLICTSFPGSGTLALIRRLPDNLEFWHFGDADPSGFEILRDLRERSGRPFQSLHMQYRVDDTSPTLSTGEERCLRRLMANPVMLRERETIQTMLHAGRKGRFEQESLGRPLSRWPFYQAV